MLAIDCFTLFYAHLESMDPGPVPLLGDRLRLGLEPRLGLVLGLSLRPGLGLDLGSGLDPRGPDLERYLDFEHGLGLGLRCYIHRFHYLRGDQRRYYCHYGRRLIHRQD